MFQDGMKATRTDASFNAEEEEDVARYGTGSLLLFIEQSCKNSSGTYARSYINTRLFTLFFLHFLLLVPFSLKVRLHYIRIFCFVMQQYIAHCQNKQKFVAIFYCKCEVRYTYHLIPFSSFVCVLSICAV